MGHGWPGPSPHLKPPAPHARTLEIHGVSSIIAKNKSAALVQQHAERSAVQKEAEGILSVAPREAEGRLKGGPDFAAQPSCPQPNGGELEVGWEE